MEARCYTELGRPLRAVPLLTNILASYDPSHARELALYLSWLAVAYIDANEPEAATAAAERMIDLSRDLPSDRVAHRIQIVVRRLQPFATAPEVKHLLARVKTRAEDEVTSR